MNSSVARRALPVASSLLLCACWPAVLGSCSGGGGGNPGVITPPSQTTNTALENLNQETSESLIAAMEDLEAVLADSNQSQSHNLAHTLLGATRTAVFLDDNQGSVAKAGGSTLAQLLADLQINLRGLSLFELLDDKDDNLVGPGITKDFPDLERVQLWLSGELGQQLAAAAADFEAVQPGWSEVVTGILAFDAVELDYGDCQFIASGLRAAQAGLLLQRVFDLRANIYELDRRAEEWRNGGSESPYRLFCGDSPDSIVQHATSSGMPSREGFLNEANLLHSANTFDTTPEAGPMLNQARLALLHSLRNLRRGVEYQEDGNSGDDLIYLTDRCGYDALWFNDVEAALSRTDSVVEAVHLEQPLCDDTIDLPGFTLNPSIVFSSSTYSGRLFLPDYGGGDTVADEGSFDHLLSSDIPQLVADLGGGDTLSGADLLAVWNDINGAWDELWTDIQLEPGAY